MARAFFVIIKSYGRLRINKSIRRVREHQKMGKIQIFIDTNVLLALYGVGSDDLKQFQNLLELMEDSIQVVLPEQVKNEFYRNRDSVLSNIISKLEKFPNRYPTILRENDDFKDIQRTIKELKTKYDKIVKETEQASANETLVADNTIREIFDKCTWFEATNSIIEKAKKRMDIGNPPGKDDSYGDAINWETLIEALPNNVDLFFVSKDNDYSSMLDKQKFNSYLATEWSNKKDSKIKYFRDLNALLQSEDLKAQLAQSDNESSSQISEIISTIDLDANTSSSTDPEQEELIKKLRASRNFITTHSIIEKLSGYDNWTPNQLVQLSEALCYNSQVNMIIEDDDVLEFYKSLNLLNILFEVDDFDIVSRAIDLISAAK